MAITLLKAFAGDCIWIKYGHETPVNIIVDSGPASLSKEFKNLVDRIVREDGKIDLLILTHIDNDHIKGFERYLTYDENCEAFNQVMFNVGISVATGMHSARSAASLIDLLRKKNIPIISPAYRGFRKNIGEGKITLLTPTKDAAEYVIDIIEKNKKPSFHSYREGYKDLDYLIEFDEYSKDNSKTNRASISFVLSYKDKNFAFLGDAHCEDILDGINIFFDGYKIDLIKLSHHGSSRNITKEFIEKVNCNQFILSTDKPIDKRTLARIIDKNKTSSIYCNYKWWQNNPHTKEFYFTDRDKEYLLNGTINLVYLDNKNEEIINEKGDELCSLRRI